MPPKKGGWGLSSKRGARARPTNCSNISLADVFLLLTISEYFSRGRQTTATCCALSSPPGNSQTPRGQSTSPRTRQTRQVVPLHTLRTPRPLCVSPGALPGRPLSRPGSWPGSWPGLLGFGLSFGDGSWPTKQASVACVTRIYSGRRRAKMLKEGQC